VGRLPATGPVGVGPGTVLAVSLFRHESRAGRPSRALRACAGREALGAVRQGRVGAAPEDGWRGLPPRCHHLAESAPLTGPRSVRDDPWSRATKRASGAISDRSRSPRSATCSRTADSSNRTISTTQSTTKPAPSVSAVTGKCHNVGRDGSAIAGSRPRHRLIDGMVENVVQTACGALWRSP
jgi:hypothetical protein